MSLAIIAINYAGSLVVEHIASIAIMKVFRSWQDAFERKVGRAAAPSDIDPTSAAVEDLDPSVMSSAEALFSSDPTLRRVRLVSKVFEGARILWVDDAPRGNTYEAGFLRALGATVEQVFTTEEAVARVNAEEYDVVISDMDRAGDSAAGLSLLKRIGGGPIVFYITRVDPDRDRPRGSLGVVSRPDDLFNLIMDALERTRS